MKKQIFILLCDLKRAIVIATVIMVLLPGNSIGKPKLDLPGSIELLNQWGEQPADIQHAFAVLFNALESNPDATYIEAMQGSESRPACIAAGLSHLGGPMLGAVTSEGARVWVRTLGPAKVGVEVITAEGVKTFGPVASTAGSDLSAVVEVTGLKPSTRYPYRVLIDGKPVKIPEHSVITTAPQETDVGKVRIAFGTCSHRKGLGNQKLWTLIRKREPSAMLLGGDIAVQDRGKHCGLHRADYLLRDFFPAWTDFCAAVPVYATWDDHDYFSNDKSGVPKGFNVQDKQNICDVFARAWNNPSYGFGVERRGVFFRTRVGPCDVIMLDNRYFRGGKKGSFLGDEQMEWLEKQLLDCKAPFKILSCGTMWSDYVSRGKDSWGRWDPEGRERILSFIEKNRIRGVLLISGDRHGARGFRIPRPGGFNFYEFEAASLGGLPELKGPPATQPEWTTQLYGIASTYAFGEFSIDATLHDPEVTFRLIQDTGEIVYELTLKLSQLTPPSI